MFSKNAYQIKFYIFFIDYKNIAYTLQFAAGTNHDWNRQLVTTALNNNITVFCTAYTTVNADTTGPVNVTETQTWWNFLDQNLISYLNYAIEY